MQIRVGRLTELQSLAYYYIRTLIHRPAVGSSLGNKSSPCVISLAESSKHIIQIVQLLEERSMSFSFCLNKNEMLTLCGLSLLYHGLDLKQEGKLMQDGNRLVAVVIKYLASAKAPGAADFKRLAAAMINLDTQSKPSNGRSSDNGMAAPSSGKPATSPPTHQKHSQRQPPLHRHASATMSERDLLSQQEKLRRVTSPNISIQPPVTRASTDSARPKPAISKRDYRSSVPQLHAMLKPRAGKNSNLPNLDYLSLNNTPASSQPQSPGQVRTSTAAQITHGSIVPTSAYSGPKTTADPSEWEVLLGSFDDRNLYDAIYGGGPGSAQPSTATTSSNYGSWSPDSWDFTSAPVGDFVNAPTSQSVLSLSEESLSSGSGEELSATEAVRPDARYDYKDPFLPGTTIPVDTYGYLYDGSDTSFGL